MKVKTVNGTEARMCLCSSWLEHWTTFSTGSSPQSCAVGWCGQPAQVGAVVHKSEQADHEEYIVPLCSSHTGRSEPLDIGFTPLAPANLSETCLRPIVR